MNRLCLLGYLKNRWLFEHKLRDLGGRHLRFNNVKTVLKLSESGKWPPKRQCYNLFLGNKLVLFIRHCMIYIVTKMEY